MSERSISVRLRANVSDFKREIGSASDSLGDLAKRAGGAEKVAQTSLGRIAQSARLQREAWTTAGAGLAAFGAAVTGIGVAALNTGIQYNTLQQTSRAALRTLTGSAEAANAQMDRLDEFARTSPFAKDVFIKAQQQMLGFGIEAEKVIPYLSAINDAVAATGGSNQDIAELTRIFSQVQAASKITAVDLMQFGQRGVDAATLIGSQMGKTGAQIREDITNGSLDAGAALDALAAGMSERFEGASANVKNTFAGAFDRVKAAWRDLSSDLAAPLVGPEGGGLAVEGLNTLADSLRTFQDLPEPVKVASTALGGLAGAASLAGGAFLLLAPRALDTYAAVKTLSSTLPAVATGLNLVKAAAGPMGLALVAGTAFLGAYIQEQKMARQMAEDLAATLDTQTGSITENTNAWVANALSSEQFFGIGYGSKSRIEAAEEMGISVETLTKAWLGQSEAVDDARAAIEEYNDSNTGRTWLIGNKQGDTLLRDLDKQITAMETAREIASAKAEVDAAATSAQEGLGGAYEDTADAMAEQVAKMEELLDAQREALGITLSASDAEIRFREAIERTSTVLNENGAGLDLNTEKGRANQSALNDLVKASWDHIDALMATNPSAKTARAAMDEARDAFERAAIQAGVAEEDVDALADSMGYIPKNVNTVIQANATQAIAAAEAALRAIGAIPTYKHLTIDGSLTSRFEAAQRAAASTTFTTLRRAEGGPVYGPGSGTSDSIPAWLSNGEYVVNAASTSKYRQILELINAGRYAGGGQVRPQSYMSTSAAAAPMSLDGLAITGRLEMDTSGFVRLVDGQIRQSKRAGQLAGRPA